MKRWLEEIDNIIQTIKYDMNNNFNNNNISARITDLESIITLILHELSNNSNIEGRNQIENHLENVQNVIDNVRNEMKSVLFYYY